MIPSSQCDGLKPDTGRHLDNRLMASSLFKAPNGTYLLTKELPPGCEQAGTSGRPLPELQIFCHPRSGSPARAE